MKIALTGGIACGKSLVAKFLRELGVWTLDADDVVHELEAPGGAAVPAIAARFGQSVLAPDGGIDRAKLAAIVFSDPCARRDLEQILLPAVRRRLQGFVREAEAARPERRELRVAIIPLLFESHWEDDYDIILCVSSSVGRQIDRMVNFRGYTQEQAEARLAAQMAVAEKSARADRTIHNNSTQEKLKAETRRLVAWLEARLEQKT